jgi:hypothetical protein
MESIKGRLAKMTGVIKAAVLIERRNSRHLIIIQTKLG